MLATTLIVLFIFAHLTVFLIYFDIVKNDGYPIEYTIGGVVYGLLCIFIYARLLFYSDIDYLERAKFIKNDEFSLFPENTENAQHIKAE